MAKKLKTVDWPARVKAILKANGWTHAELARRVGVTGPCVSQYVTGYTNPGKAVAMLLRQIEKNPNATLDDILATN